MIGFGPVYLPNGISISELIVIFKQRPETLWFSWLLLFQVFTNKQCVIIISENEYEHKLDHVRNGQTYFLVKTEN